MVFISHIKSLDKINEIKTKKSPCLIFSLNMKDEIANMIK